MLQLEDRAVVALSGPEAVGFLQGLVTNDVTRVNPQSLLYAALLTPQGKVLFDFLIGSDGEALYLDCAADAREALVKRLSLYRLRAKIEIVPRDDLIVAWSDAAENGYSFVRDPRQPDLGYRAILRRTDHPLEAGAKKFEALRLARGVPEGSDFGRDVIFALDADLDELGGISFDKGCYVGQELTARMKHRGTARKRLLPVLAKDGAAMPEPGAPVAANGSEIGRLQSAHGSRGFALIRLDKLVEIGEATFKASDTAIEIQSPGWLFS